MSAPVNIFCDRCKKPFVSGMTFPLSKNTLDICTECLSCGFYIPTLEYHPTRGRKNPPTIAQQLKEFGTYTAYPGFGCATGMSEKAKTKAVEQAIQHGSFDCFTTQTSAEAMATPAPAASPQILPTPPTQAHCFWAPSTTSEPKVLTPAQAQNVKTNYGSFSPNGSPDPSQFTFNQGFCGPF